MTTGKLALLAAALPFALLACSENGFVAQTDPGDIAPDIDVTPLSLDFGTLSAGDESVQTFEIASVGTTDLTVSRLQIAGDGYELLTEVTDLVLPPGESTSVDVAFSPLGDSDQLGVVDVFSNDPDEGAVEVDLHGAGAVPSLQIDPDPYDFGVDYIGCGNGQDFQVTNVGSDTLVVDQLWYENAENELHLTDGNTYPLTLEPGASAPLHVDFMPAVEGAIRGELHATSNDPRGEVVAKQTAEGQYVGRGEDQFAIPENPPVDIVFAVDQSCSMDDDVTRIGNNFSRFISDISNITNDWRIGVVTKDSGCFNGGILRSTTPDYVTKFQTAVGGDFGNYTEALLTLGYNALAATTGNGCNGGFLRPNAMLHFILVSDEPEQSWNNWSYYVNNFLTYKSDPALVKISAVAGDYPNGCATAEAGAGYYEAVQATGGIYLSICDTDWASHASELATASLADIYNFTLSDTPDVATIRVWVNGTEWTSGWHYDAPSNQVRFDDDLGSGTLTVKYGVLAPCD
jgi:hypothetical protein